MNTEYIIIGDTKEYKDCLIYVIGSSYERAKQVLYRILNDPNENDKKITEGHTNIRIEEIDKKHCWWRDNCE